MVKLKAKKFLSYLFSLPRMPHPPKNRVMRFFLLLCGWGAFLLLPLYSLLMTEYIHFANKTRTLSFVLNRTPVLLFDLALLYLLYFCILCLVKKGWLGTLLFSAGMGALSYIDYLKHAMTGDYFYPWDIVQQAGNVDELLHFITVPFPVLYTIMIAFGLLLSVLVYFSGAELPVKLPVRLPLLAAAVCFAYFSVSTPQKVTTLLNRNSLYLEDMALQTSNYSSNGFVGAFTVNVLSANIQKPEGYGRDAVDALLAPYDAVPADDGFSSPDVILVLSESFWDPTLLPGTTFTDAETGEPIDPLPNYRALCEKEGVISGLFFTTGFGGGTVRPEFEVLTGLSTDHLPSGCVPWQYITEETESYVSLYRDLGYHTMAVHPYTSSFYNRKAAYPLIGIDTLHFEDDIYALAKAGTVAVYISGKQITDGSFVRAIKYYMDEEGDAPTFVLGISMENHQPYPNKFDTFTILAENPAFDENTAEAVKNFTQGVYDADVSLKMLTDYIDAREKDTILVWYGDHLPTLGSDSAAYKQSGMIGTYDGADYERMYSTPFLIYANFELGESTLVHPGKDNRVASYNLMNAAAELIGAPRTAVMRWLSDYGTAVPYYNIRLHRKVGEAEQAYIDAHSILTYDRTAGGRYSLK